MNILYLRVSGIVRWNMFKKLKNHLRILLSLTDGKISRLKILHSSSGKRDSIYRTMMESSPLPIAILDSDLNPVRLNRKFTETFGYSFDDSAIMAEWWEFARPDSEFQGAVSKNRHASSSSNGQNNIGYTKELKLSCKDGSVKDLEFYSTNMTQDRILLIFKDITDIKAAQKALILDELRLEALLELNHFKGSFSSDILYFCLEKIVELTESQIGYVGFVNEVESTVSIFAWSGRSSRYCRVKDTCVVYRLDEIGLWGDSIRERKPTINNNLVKNTISQESTLNGHINIRNHLGVPIFDNNRIVMLAGVGNKNGDYDNSDIRQMTLLMECAWKFIQRRQDEEKIKKYTEELARNNKELESLDRMKDEFTANVTHELKTPLISIKGFSELLFEGHLGHLEEEQKKSVGAILQNSLRLEKLIDSLLYMQNIHTGNIQYHLDSVDIVVLLERVADDMLSLRNGNHPCLHKEYELPVGYVCGNITYLEQVFCHILENAFKFTPPDGSVTVCVSQEKNSIHVIVKDTGIGISENKLPHIFKKFYQVDGSLTRRYGGNGLGLYLCKSVVEAHGGNIWVQSEEGKGTELHVILPVIDEET